MQKTDKDTTPEACLERSPFTCAAVHAYPLVKGLEDPLRACHKDIKSATRALQDMGELKQEKRAIVVVLDAASDGVVNELVGRLLLMVNKNYDHPTYRRYVPGSVRDITQAEMRTEEPALISEIIKMLGEDKAQPGLDTLAAEFIPRLQMANDAFIGAEKELADVEDDIEHLDKKTLPALVVAWGIQWITLHAALTKAWPQDPDRVERCFQPFRKPKSKKGPTGTGGGSNDGSDDGSG